MNYTSKFGDKEDEKDTILNDSSKGPEKEVISPLEPWQQATRNPPRLI